MCSCNARTARIEQPAGRPGVLGLFPGSAAGEYSRQSGELTFVPLVVTAGTLVACGTLLLAILSYIGAAQQVRRS